MAHFQVDTATPFLIRRIAMRSASGTATIAVEMYRGGQMGFKGTKSVTTTPTLLPGILGADWRDDFDGMKIMAVTTSAVHFAYVEDGLVSGVDTTSQRIPVASYVDDPYFFGVS